MITPNLPEAELLAGQEIKTLEDMKALAQKLHDLERQQSLSREAIASVRIRLWMFFYDGQTFTVLENPVIQDKMLVQVVPLPQALPVTWLKVMNFFQQ